MDDVWSAGAAYEAYIGRWSRLVATDFVGRLDVPAGLRWLDVGCGTGALSAAVLERADPAVVVGADPSSAFLAAARSAGADPRCGLVAADARHLPFADAGLDVVVSGLALNFVPSPEAALAEAVRVSRPGAVVAGYVWDYADGMAMLRHFWDAVVELDPGAAALDEGRRFPLCRAEPLAALWAGAGLADVHVSAVEIPTVFRDLEDYWKPFLGGQGPAPGYVATLDDAARARLRDAVLARLPVSADGTIPLRARAWTASGRR